MTIVERLKRRIKINQKNGCWEWLGAKYSNGYGAITITVDGKPRAKLTHRISYEVFCGPIPEGLCVLHKCDNPKCINPAHLFVGTYKDNMQDAKAKGRVASGRCHWTNTHPQKCLRGILHWSRFHPERLAVGDRHNSRTHPELIPRGELHWNSKLTEVDVIAIREAYATGKVTKTQLGLQFGVSRPMIYSIVNNESWKHITPPPSIDRKLPAKP